MPSLSCCGGSLLVSPCRLWRQRGQNLSTQCPPRCSFLSNSVCSSCASEGGASEGGAYSDPQLPQPASGHLSPQLGATTTCNFGCDYHFHNAASYHQRHAFLVGEARKLSNQEAACTAVGVSFVPIVMESRWYECPSCEFFHRHWSPPRSTIGDSNS